MMEKIYSELEIHVMADMVRQGYNIDDPLDIEAYWEQRLS
jgi:hypothetical protein